MSSGRDGKEEVMIQMFIGEPMSKLKVQMKPKRPRSNFLTFDHLASFDIWILTFVNRRSTLFQLFVILHIEPHSEEERLKTRYCKESSK